MSVPNDFRVIVLNDFCYVQGGASRVAIDEALGLARSGVKVTFVGGVGPVCRELREASLTVVDLGQSELSSFRSNPGVAFQGLWNQTAYDKVKTLIGNATKRPCIVHVHGFTKLLSSSPIRAAINNNAKVICTLHDFFAACPTGAFFNFVENKVCPLRALSASCITTNCDKRSYSHKLYRVARSLAQRHLGGLPAGVNDYIALSNKSMSVLRPYLPAGARVRLLANPVDAVWKTPVDVASNESVVAVGRLDTEKGTALLVDAARQTGTRVTFVGDGPWRQYAERYALCKVTGWLPQEEVLAQLEHARCLIFPSLWYETFGLVVEEAAARGIPCIVSDISAASERVIHGITGWHVRAGAREELARALAVIKNDGVIGAAGVAAFERYWQKPLTLARHTADLTEIYRDVLATA
jgi:glycosyltransferase involved in cell wall biosynthesis